MASYTSSTTPAEEALLTAAASLRGKTNQEYVAEGWARQMTALARTGNHKDAEVVAASYASTTSAEKRNQVRAILELPTLPAAFKSPLWVDPDALP